MEDYSIVGDEHPVSGSRRAAAAGGASSSQARPGVPRAAGARAALIGSSQADRLASRPAEVPEPARTFAHSRAGVQPRTPGRRMPALRHRHSVALAWHWHPPARRRLGVLQLDAWSTECTQVRSTVRYAGTIIRRYDVHGEASLGLLAVGLDVDLLDRLVLRRVVRRHLGL